MKRLEIMDLLDRYFNGLPTVEEQQLVEKHRKNDPKFESIFKEYEVLVQGIHSFSREQLKNELKAEFDQNTKAKPLKPKPRIPAFNRWRSIAAALLLLLIATGIYRYQTQYERLYQAYEPDRVADIYASAGAEKNAIKFEQSLSAYNEGIKMAKQPETRNEAIKKLNTISPEIEFYYFWAQYEIALIYLLLEKKSEAKAQLNRVINLTGEHIAKEKAADLLAKLNAPWHHWF